MTEKEKLEIITNSKQIIWIAFIDMIKNISITFVICYSVYQIVKFIGE